MNKQKKGSFSLSTFLLIMMLIAGLSLLLYPTISDWWNSKHQSQAVATYAEFVQELDEDAYEKLWEEAVAFNKKLNQFPQGMALPKDMEKAYNKALAVDNSGIMGSVEIPAIKVSLPIYHGTSDDVLQVAIGHLEWTNLPTGGEGNHTVISGHRGLPSAKLFTHIDQLREGDVFMLRVLDEVLTYEIDQILIVEPDKIKPLYRVKGKDYCTLMTCTPYGVNSHRLMLRGHRIENLNNADLARIHSDAMQIEPMVVATIIAIPLLLIAVIILLWPKKKRKEETLWLK
ncbi:MAG: class C sortase [Firmicutes bacterium]|nr:class C sortase [Bacillota bacterium]